MSAWISQANSAVEVVLVWYFFALNGGYFLLSLLAFREVHRHLRRSIYGGYEQLTRSPLTPGVSILVPAHDEEVNIALNVNNLLHLDYTRYEVIIINDGSTDKTLERLKESFGLVESPRRADGRLKSKPVRAVYTCARHHNLIVIDKEKGGKSDALNAGLGLCQYPYFCSIDADVIMESDALQRVIQPIVEGDERVIAVGGIVRVANDCVVDKGRVTQVRMGSNPLVLFQIVEYFRAFLCGRTGFSVFNGLMIISGAFGIFEHELVVGLGGYDTKTVGEDLDLVTRLHAHMRRHSQQAYSVQFVPDPVCWTEVPSSIGVLARQRRRWQRGLLEVLSAHGRMFLNPRFGALGLVAYPFFFLFEGWGIIIELIGYAFFALMWWRGGIHGDFALAFLCVAIACGWALSLCGIILSEMTPRRYPDFRHLAAMICFALLENLGYRQMTSVLRLLGIWDYLRGRSDWGAMKRVGFSRREAR